MWTLARFPSTTDFLGLEVGFFDLGLGGPDFQVTRQRRGRCAARGERCVTASTGPLTYRSIPECPMSTRAYELAVQRGYEIVHPLTTEAWGG